MANGKKKVSRWTPEQKLQFSEIVHRALTAFRDGTGDKAKNPTEKGFCTVLLAMRERKIVEQKIRAAEEAIGIHKPESN